MNSEARLGPFAMEVILGTGYEVPISSDRMPEDLDHLAQAFIGEILLPASKNYGLDSGVSILIRAIINALSNLKREERDYLLSSMILDRIAYLYGQCEEAIVTKGGARNGPENSHRGAN